MWRKGRSQTKSDLAGVSGARYGLFLSFDKGMQVLVDAIADKIAAGLPGQFAVRLNTRVESITRNAPTDQQGVSWRILTDRGETLTADAVCLATPAYAAASLLQDVNGKLAAQLREINYASTATINLAYRRADVNHPLEGFGFVVPFIEKRTLIACTFSSIKFPGRAPNDPEVFALQESEMVDRVRKDLRELLGIVNEPLFAETARWQRSMPQYELGHLERVAAIENELAQIPNVALAGNSYRGAGIPDCIRSGETAADVLFSNLNTVE
jgi:oxygen-dependent protoporphyrinogen oxidase